MANAGSGTVTVRKATGTTFTAGTRITAVTMTVVTKTLGGGSLADGGADVLETARAARLQRLLQPRTLHRVVEGELLGHVIRSPG